MRKAIILLLFSLFCIFANAQEQQVKISLKGGNSVVGTMVSMDGVTSVTISVGGIQTTISMEDILSIEPYSDSQTGTEFQTSQAENTEKVFEELTANDLQNVLLSDQGGDYVILDDADYPESFELTVADQTFTMILIRGGVFNMGYDGPNSISYKSEPIHKVKVSSFYVSKEFINEGTAYKLLSGKGGKDGAEFRTTKWESAEQVVGKIAEQTGLQYRLVREAEWFYIAVTPYAKPVFANNNISEWCYDLLGEYSSGPQIDPTGPTTGKQRLILTYFEDHKKWLRDFGISYAQTGTFLNKPQVRIAISAKEVVSQSEGTLF